MGEKKFGELWRDLLGDIIEGGVLTTPRKQRCFELENVQLVAPMEFNVLVSHIRKPNYRFMVAEWLWISGGFSDVASIARYNSVISQFSDDGQTLYGAYGKRWNNQRAFVLNTLNRDPETRQAIVNLWTPNPPLSKDIPCTLTWQFLIRDNKLNMTVNMRSSDAWLGLPYDWFVFSQIGNEVAQEFEIPRGTLTLNLTSSHLYERDIEKAKEVVNHYDYKHMQPIYPATLRSPALTDAISGGLYRTFRLEGGELPSNPIELHYAKALMMNSSLAALEELIVLENF